MIYLKSVLVGILGLITFAAALLCTEFVAAAIWIRSHDGNESVFVHFSNRSPLVWIIALFIFGFGFRWKYRKDKAGH
jgi:hypothetical protein